MEQQPAFIQPAAPELARKQSGLCPQQLEAASTAYFQEKLDAQPAQVESQIAPAVVDIQLQNPVLHAVANDSLPAVNRSGTPEPGVQCCCSDVYTTDSCGESSAAESVDTLASAASAAASAASITAMAGEKRLGRRLTNKRRRTAERGPRLSVLSVQGSVVECQVETSKQETVTFKFDQADTVPADVANNLIKHRLLSEQHADIFIEQVFSFNSTY